MIKKQSEKLITSLKGHYTGLSDFGLLAPVAVAAVVSVTQLALGCFSAGYLTDELAPLY